MYSQEELGRDEQRPRLKSAASRKLPQGSGVSLVIWVGPPGRDSLFLVTHGTQRPYPHNCGLPQLLAGVLMPGHPASVLPDRGQQIQAVYLTPELGVVP